MDPGQVKQSFLQIIQEMGLKVKSVEITTNARVLDTSVMFAEEKNIRLDYRVGFFNMLTPEEIIAVLSHEACHIAVLPHTTYWVNAGDPESIEIQKSII